MTTLTWIFLFLAIHFCVAFFLSRLSKSYEDITFDKLMIWEFWVCLMILFIVFFILVIIGELVVLLIEMPFVYIARRKKNKIIHFPDCDGKIVRKKGSYYCKKCQQEIVDKEVIWQYVLHSSFRTQESLDFDKTFWGKLLLEKGEKTY